MAKKLEGKIALVTGGSSGLGLATAVRDTLGDVADSGCNISVKKGDKDFSAAVTQVKGVSPDAVFYGGYYSEAAPLVQQLKDGGFKGTFVSADGTKDPEFVKQAGEASKDAILSCPCGPATGAFADEYNARLGNIRTDTLPDLDAAKGENGYRLIPTERIRSKQAARYADEARERFEKVAADHPGTPWAVLARAVTETNSHCDVPNVPRRTVFILYPACLVRPRYSFFKAT